MAESTPQVENVIASTSQEVVPQKPRISDLLVVTGYINQLRDWHNRLDDIHIYETMGSVVGMYQPQPHLAEPSSDPEPTEPFTEAILVIKDKVRYGPTFKVFYPVFERPLSPLIKIGSMVRVVGKLINKTMMRAIKVSIPNLSEVNHFDRVANVCSNRVMKCLQDADNGQQAGPDHVKVTEKVNENTE